MLNVRKILRIITRTLNHKIRIHSDLELYRRTRISLHHNRTNPIGVAEGKYSQKKRLIVDMSAPHNDENNTCLNDMIVKEDFSLNYVTVDDAIDRIKEKGKGSWLCKTDIKDAFKVIPTYSPFVMAISWH